MRLILTSLQPLAMAVEAAAVDIDFRVEDLLNGPRDWNWSCRHRLTGLLTRRIARRVSLLPSPEATTTFGQYRVNPNGFIRALGTPEDNLALGTAADEALLSRLQSHRNFDSNSPPESPPTPATPATPPPTTTPTPARSRSRTPPLNPLRLVPDTSTSTSTPWTTSSRGSTPSTLSSALDRSHQRPLDGRGLLHMVIFGRQHDIEPLHRPRPRLILRRFHHHLPQPLLRELHAATSEHDFLSQARFHGVFSFPSLHAAFVGNHTHTLLLLLLLQLPILIQFCFFGSTSGLLDFPV